MLFVQIGDTHQDIYERGMRYFAITFTLDVSGEPGGPNRVFRRGINPEEQMTDVPAIQASKAISRLVESEDSCESAFAHHAANGLFTAFFWETIQRLDTGLLSPLLMESAIQESFKQALLRCFEKNLTGKITLAELARTLGMSESSLSHKTREILGVPPLRALTNHKMQKARQMLLETNLSIKEISENLGFENQFHFSRTFKSCFGQSPAKHR
jgi:AraC-like DNA-binding protein